MAQLSLEQLKNNLKAMLASEAGNRTDAAFLELTGDIDGQPFQLAVRLSPSFLQSVRKNRLQGQAALYNAYGNLKYGYDPVRAASPGGKDGIFNVSSDYRPRNEMVAKLYDRYLHTDRGERELRQYFARPSEAQGVRVVCHGVRLLGFMDVREQCGTLIEKLVLVDVDVNKR